MIIMIFDFIFFLEWLVPPIRLRVYPFIGQFRKGILFALPRLCCVSVTFVIMFSHAPCGAKRCCWFHQEQDRQIEIKSCRTEEQSVWVTVNWNNLNVEICSIQIGKSSSKSQNSLALLAKFQWKLLWRNYGLWFFLWVLSVKFIFPESLILCVRWCCCWLSKTFVVLWLKPLSRQDFGRWYKSCCCGIAWDALCLKYECHMIFFHGEKHMLHASTNDFWIDTSDALDKISTVFQRWLCMMAKQCAEHQDGDPKEHLCWVCCSPLTGIDDWNRPFRLELLCGRQSFQMRWLTIQAGSLFA